MPTCVALSFDPDNTPRERFTVPSADIPIALLHGRVWTPEEKLLCAVLLSAVETIEKYRGMTQPVARAYCAEVKRWMAGAPARLPFRWLCLHLGLDPEAVRASVLSESTDLQRRRRQWL